MVKLKIIIATLVGVIILIFTRLFKGQSYALERKAKELDKKAEIYHKEEQRLRDKVDSLDEQLEEIDRAIEVEAEKPHDARSAAERLRRYLKRTSRGSGR